MDNRMGSIYLPTRDYHTMSVGDNNTIKTI